MRQLHENTYAGNASNLRRLSPIQMALRCFQPLEQFKAAVVQHHWHSRFYQQLSPVVALLQMATLYRRYGEFSDNIRQPGPSIQAKPERGQWLHGWLEAPWSSMIGMAAVGIVTAFQWMKECPSLGSDTPEVLEGLRPGCYDFGNEDFRNRWTKYLVYLLYIALLPPHELQRETAWSVRNLSERQWRLRHLTEHIVFMTHLPTSEEVMGAHVNMNKTLRHIKDAAKMRAAIRTTCKDMAACMAAEWAVLQCLWVSPDIPGCHDKCAGAGYHQGMAWSILCDQLRAMESLTEKSVFIRFRQRRQQQA